MSFVFQRDQYGVRIINPDAEFILGDVKRRGKKYNVRNGEGETVAAVKSVADAIPVLLRHYEYYPPKWERDTATQFTKMTPFAFLEIVQGAFGMWYVHRNTRHTLLRDGKPAMFATVQDAQRVADAHLRDGLPNSDTPVDGFVWSPEPSAAN